MSPYKNLLRGMGMLLLSTFLCGIMPPNVDIHEELEKSPCIIFAQVVNTTYLGKKFMFTESVVTLDVKLARGKCADYQGKVVPMTYVSSVINTYPLAHRLIVGTYIIVSLNHIDCYPNLQLITDSRGRGYDFIFYCGGDGYRVLEPGGRISCGFSDFSREPETLSREDIMGK